MGINGREKKNKVFLFHLKIWEKQFSVNSSRCTPVGCLVSSLSGSVVSVGLGGLAASFFSSVLNCSSVQNILHQRKKMLSIKLIFFIRVEDGS